MPIVTQYGFVLDQRACIGCHACTVACKVEHGVELGVNRTWVKYIEHGTFPDNDRSFSVMRCNQCTDAPCVEVCPVTALYKREDGIVDFDSDRCIGCKACLNACPYDALYIDPNNNTAGKCNFCAHRVDEGMQPACEVVCPTDAIISGDVDDPTSRVRQMIDVLPHAVRAADQGTGPNVFYIGAHEATLDPLQAGGGDGFLYSEVRPSEQEKLAPLSEDAQAKRMLDVAHPTPWGWKVSSYFLTKGIAAGVMMLAGAFAVADVLSGVIALAGIAATGGFLIADLKRPERFIYLFTKPQWRSWLARGTHVINAAGVSALAFTVAAVLGADGLRDVLGWIMIPVGALLAGYTAFLFGQCEGRDLWQSHLLLPHTIVNAIAAGAAALGVATLFGAAGEEVVRWALVVGCALSLVIIVIDTWGGHPTRGAERAALNLRRDMFATRFFTGLAGLLAGVVLPLASGAPAVLAVAGILVMVGLWLYEDAWVRAGQSVPLS